MADRRSITGHAAAFIAYAIFGFNIIVCKDLTSGHLIPPPRDFHIKVYCSWSIILAHFPVYAW